MPNLPPHFRSDNPAATTLAYGSPLRAARADAVLQQIEEAFRGASDPPRGIPIGEVFSHFGNIGPRIDGDGFTLTAIEIALDDLGASGRVRLVADDGTVRIRLLEGHPLAAPRTPAPRPAPYPPSQKPALLAAKPRGDG